MGDSLTHGLGGRGHWLDMLGGEVGKAQLNLSPHELWRRDPIPNRDGVVGISTFRKERETWGSEEDQNQSQKQRAGVPAPHKRG